MGHSSQLSRVHNNIGEGVLRFCEGRVGQEFRMEELRTYVRETFVAAPESPGRILRVMRKKGSLGYTLLSRSESLYRVDWVDLNFFPL